MNDLKAAVLADRLDSYVQLKGGCPIPLAGAATIAEIEIGYLDSKLNGPRRPGVQAGSGRTVETIGGRGDDRVGIGDALYPADGIADETARLLKAYRGLLDPTSRRSPHDGGDRLARPDGYVVAVANVGEVEEDIGSRLATVRTEG